jgi:hypothetical protein
MKKNMDVWLDHRKSVIVHITNDLVKTNSIVTYEFGFSVKNVCNEH